jgi:hypothetical protein
MRARLMSEPDVDVVSCARPVECVARHDVLDARGDAAPKRADRCAPAPSTCPTPVTPRRAGERRGAIIDALGREYFLELRRATGA